MNERSETIEEEFVYSEYEPVVQDIKRMSSEYFELLITVFLLAFCINIISDSIWFLVENIEPQTAAIYRFIVIVVVSIMSILLVIKLAKMRLGSKAYLYDSFDGHFFLNNETGDVPFLDYRNRYWLQALLSMIIKTLDDKKKEEAKSTLVQAIHASYNDRGKILGRFLLVHLLIDYIGKKWRFLSKDEQPLRAEEVIPEEKVFLDETERTMNAIAFPGKFTHDIEIDEMGHFTIIIHNKGVFKTSMEISVAARQKPSPLTTKKDLTHIFGVSSESPITDPAKLAYILISVDLEAKFSPLGLALGRLNREYSWILALFSRIKRSMDWRYHQSKDRD